MDKNADLHDCLINYCFSLILIWFSCFSYLFLKCKRQCPKNKQGIPQFRIISHYLWLVTGCNGYYIPYGGLFELITCPNYFGELVEWLGWSLATWSLAGLVFTLFAAATFIPRSWHNHNWWVSTEHQMSRDFQQCGILTSVDSGEPVQSPFKLRNSKWCSVISLSHTIFKQLAKALIRLCCLSHISHCWKSHALAHFRIKVDVLKFWTLFSFC